MLMALTVCKSGFLPAFCLGFRGEEAWHVLQAGIVSIARLLPNLFSN